MQLPNTSGERNLLLLGFKAMHEEGSRRRVQSGEKSEVAAEMRMYANGRRAVSEEGEQREDEIGAG
jgi:hypothetical protein